MTQAIITWIIIALALLFVGRWAFRKVKGDTPDCCTNDDQAQPCSRCTIMDQCEALKDEEKI